MMLASQKVKIDDTLKEIGACEIIKRANKLLARKANWCRSNYARDKNGDGIDVTNDAAVSFCILGSTYRAAYELLREHDLDVDKMHGVVYTMALVDDLVGNQLRDQVPPNVEGIIAYNDESASFTDIKRLLKRTREAVCK